MKSININHKTFIIYSSKYIQKLVQKHIDISIKSLGKNTKYEYLLQNFYHQQIQASFDFVAWLSGLSVKVKRIVVSNGVLRFDKVSGNHRQSHTPTRVKTENCPRWKNGHVALAGNSGIIWKLSMYQEKPFYVIY